MFPFFSYFLIFPMRLLSLVFLLLILLIQYPLWLGKGGWLRVWELDKQVQQVKASNEKLKQRNGVLASEVNDLKNGTDAVEERARFELGMIKKDEVFVQILDEGSKIEITTASKAKSTLPPPKH
jgi:cell division protein FtsB